MREGRVTFQSTEPHTDCYISFPSASSSGALKYPFPLPGTHVEVEFTPPLLGIFSWPGVADQVGQLSFSVHNPPPSKLGENIKGHPNVHGKYILLKKKSMDSKKFCTKTSLPFSSIFPGLFKIPLQNLNGTAETPFLCTTCDPASTLYPTLTHTK